MSRAWCAGFIVGLCGVFAAAPVFAQIQFDLDATAATALSSGVDDDQLGRSVAVIGDINGDGHDDFLVGAPASWDAARAYVVFGGATGLPSGLDPASLNGGNGFAMQLGASRSGLGIAVAGLGDINGDGHPDFVVGAHFLDVMPDASTTLYLAGAAYVVFGHAAGTPFASVLHLEALNGNDGFAIEGARSDGFVGYALADAGDFDGDGHDDVLVGALGGNGAWIVRGHPAPFPERIDLGTLAADNAGFELLGASDVEFARSVAGLGDLDGDGCDDVAVGAPGTRPEVDAGRVYVVHGRPSIGGTANVLDLDAAATPEVVRLDGDGTGYLTGYSVAGAGDVTGDDVPDVLIGAPGKDQNVGAAYLVSGAALASQTLDALVAAGDAFRFIDATAASANNAVGSALAGGADLDGDGIPDMVIGMPGGPVIDDRNGAVFVLPGHAAADPSWAMETDLSSFADGTRWNGVMRSDTANPGKLRDALALAAGGDVNGDGKPDLLIGSMHAETADPVNGPWQGKAWLPVGPPYDDTIFRDGFELLPAP